jgi:hypothetical protein
LILLPSTFGWWPTQGLEFFKWPLGWECNSKTNMVEIGHRDLECIELTLVNNSKCLGSTDLFVKRHKLNAYGTVGAGEEICRRKTVCQCFFTYFEYHKKQEVLMYNKDVCNIRSLANHIMLYI